MHPLEKKGWNVDKSSQYYTKFIKENEYGNWEIVKYKYNDWSVYLNGDYQIQYLTMAEAVSHCCE